MKARVKVKAKGLAALKIKNINVSVNMNQTRSLDTGANFGSVNNKKIQVATTVKKKGLGTFDFDIDWN